MNKVNNWKYLVDIILIYDSQYHDIFHILYFKSMNQMLSLAYP